MPNVTCFPLFWFWSHDSKSIIFYKLCNYRVSYITRPDQISAGKHPVYSIQAFQLKTVVNRHLLRIKMTPKFIVFEDNTTQLFAKFNHLGSARLNVLRSRAFLAKENASRCKGIILLNSLYIFHISGFHQDLHQQ